MSKRETDVKALKALLAEIKSMPYEKWDDGVGRCLELRNRSFYAIKRCVTTGDRIGGRGGRGGFVSKSSYEAIAIAEKWLREEIEKTHQVTRYPYPGSDSTKTVRLIVRQGELDKSPSEYIGSDLTTLIEAYGKIRKETPCEAAKT